MSASTKRQHRFYVIMYLVLLSMLSACGGGADGGSNATSSNNNSAGNSAAASYLKWSGNPNETIILDRSNQRFQVVAADRNVFATDLVKTLSDIKLDTNLNLMQSGKKVGFLGSLSNGTAVFMCDNGSQLAIVFSGNSYSVDCGTQTGTGTGNGSNGSDGFVTFAGNANTTVVLDKNNQKFQVLEKDRSVLNASKTRLNGLIVDSSGRLIQNGTQVGIVQLSKSVSNTDVAVFTCANGNRMGISNASDGYSLDCGAVSGTGNNNGSGNSGNNSNSKDGQRGDQCIRTSRDASGSLILTNTCNVKIYYNYCNLSGYGVCNPSLNSWSPSGYTYGWGTTFINPGQSDTVYGSKGTTSFYWVCVSPASPFITGFNTTSIMASSVPYGICKL